MLYVEENQVVETRDLFGDGTLTTYLPQFALSAETLNGSLLLFEMPDVMYSCHQALAAGLLLGEQAKPSLFFIKDITPSGHEFIAALKNNTVWNKVKEKAGNLGGVSLPIMLQMAADLLRSIAFPGS